MEGPGFDDPGPPVPTPVSRVRRALTVAVLLTLVVAIGFLAFVSGSYTWVGLGSLHVAAAPAEGAAGRYPSEIPVGRLPPA